MAIRSAGVMWKWKSIVASFTTLASCFILVLDIIILFPLFRILNDETSQSSTMNQLANRLSRCVILAHGGALVKEGRIIAQCAMPTARTSRGLGLFQGFMPKPLHLALQPIFTACKVNWLKYHTSQFLGQGVNGCGDALPPKCLLGR